MLNETCHEHSGCVADIDNLKINNAKQWQEIEKMSNKIDSIMAKLNVVLGSALVACLMLLLNMIIEYVK